MGKLQGWVEQGAPPVAGIQGPPGPPGPAGTTISQILGPAVVSCCDFPGSDASLKINNALSALPAGGGFVDCRCLVGAQSISVPIVIGASKTLILGDTTFTVQTSVGSAAFLINGNGASIIGSTAGGASNSPHTGQVGTVLRAATGLGPATNMISITQGTSTPTDAVEVAGLILDFADLTSSTGQHGIFMQGVSNSWIHDVTIFNPRVDGVHLEATTGHSYDVTLERIRIRSAGNDGFRFSTENGTADIDRLTLIDCTYVGYNSGDSVTRFGANGFHVIIPPASVATQGIGDLVFLNCFSSGTTNGGNGFLVTQQGSAQVFNIMFTGELEDAFQANTGTGFSVSSTGPTNVFGLDLLFTAANYSTAHNISAANASSFFVRFVTNIGAPNSFMPQTDGIQFGNRATLTGGTQATLRWVSSAGGNYSLGIGGDGILRYRRDDTNTDLWQINPTQSTLEPAVDSSWGLGRAAQRWGQLFATLVGFGVRSIPAGTSQNTIQWNSSGSGIYSLGMGADGTLRYRRDDTNADQWQWNQSFTSLEPAADNTANLGRTGQRWGSAHMVGLSVGASVLQDSGMKHARFASNTTAAPIGSTVNTTFTWPSAFPDANYTVTASIEATAGQPYILDIAKSNAQVVVVIANFTAVAASGTIDLIAMHD